MIPGLSTSKQYDIILYGAMLIYIIILVNDMIWYNTIFYDTIIY